MDGWKVGKCNEKAGWRSLGRIGNNGVIKLLWADAYFFKQEFNIHFESIDPNSTEKVTFIDLYDLFRIITKNSKFIQDSQYSYSLGYDSLDNYKYLAVKRLIYSR